MLWKELKEEPPELKFGSWCGEVSQKREARQVSASRGARCRGAESGFVAVPGVCEIGELCPGFEEQAGCGLVWCDVGDGEGGQR